MSSYLNNSSSNIYIYIYIYISDNNNIYIYLYLLNYTYYDIYGVYCTPLSDPLIGCINPSSFQNIQIQTDNFIVAFSIKFKINTY